MKKRNTLAACAAALLAISAIATEGAQAAGFRLPEAGAKAMGMGFAFTAQANDPSAIYYNPAGITQLEGIHTMAGVTYIKENGATFTGTTPLTGGATVGETQKDLNFFVPNAYATQMTKGSRIAYGIGLFSPFGLGQEYENSSTSIFRNQVTKIDLKTVVLNPTVAFKINDVLSVGVGVDFMYGWARLGKSPVNVALGDNSATPPTNNLYHLDLKADGTAWGYNAGLLLAPSPYWQVGFNYRSPFHLVLKDGDVDLTGISTAGRTTLGGASVSQAFFGGATTFHTQGKTIIELPATAALGLAVKPIDRLTVEADLDWTFWSSYSELRVEVQDQNAVLQSSSSPKNWNDVCALRIGAEYRVTDPLALRLGFAYDPTPVPDSTMGPELPDGNRLNYMAGAGYKVGPVTIDASYYYLQKKDRTVNNQSNPPVNAQGTAQAGFNGTWKGDAHLVSLDLGYKF